MKHIKSLLFVLTFLILSGSGFSQDSETNDTLLQRKGDIANQFEYLLNKSSNFTGLNGAKYKAVNLKTFNNLKANTIDSLKTIKKTLVGLNNTVKKQLTEIKGLESSLEKTKSDLSIAKAKTDSISFLGVQMSKTGYNSLMWIIIVVLTSLFLLFFYKYKEAHKITKIAQQSLVEIEEEFEGHRKTALEREQKVRRELIDEINKHKKKK